MNQLQKYVTKNFDKSISECTDQELYKVLLDFTRTKAHDFPFHRDTKKVYYFSASF